MSGKSTTRAQQRRQARRAIKDTDLKTIGSGKIKDVYRSHGSRALLKAGATVEPAKMTRAERIAMAADLAAAGVHQIEIMAVMDSGNRAKMERLLRATRLMEEGRHLDALTALKEGSE